MVCLQGYLRDGAFEARRWSAPGQLCIYPEPCSCGISTAQVPLDGVYCSEDSSVVCGKACDAGHRWICSKSIADCVEALIGAYYVGGGFGSALLLMRWFGIDVDFNENLVVQAKKNAELWMYEPRAEDIKALETKIGYVFETKGLLLEAMTHATQQELGAQYCYQVIANMMPDPHKKFIITFIRKSPVDSSLTLLYFSFTLLFHSCSHYPLLQNLNLVDKFFLVF